MCSSNNIKIICLGNLKKNDYKRKVCIFWSDQDPDQIETDPQHCKMGLASFAINCTKIT